MHNIKLYITNLECKQWRLQWAYFSHRQSLQVGMKTKLSIVYKVPTQKYFWGGQADRQTNTLSTTIHKSQWDLQRSSMNKKVTQLYLVDSDMWQWYGRSVCMYYYPHRGWSLHTGCCLHHINCLSDLLDSWNRWNELWCVKVIFHYIYVVQLCKFVAC